MPTEKDKYVTLYGSFQVRGWGMGTLVRKTGELIAFVPVPSEQVEVLNQSLWNEFNG